MAADPQLQSLFVTRLPPEMREAVYLELWKLSGLRQHIFWHGSVDDDKSRAHFCRWRCTTEFEIEDRIQKDLHEMKKNKKTMLSGIIWDPVLGHRMQSSWHNHWGCSERAQERHGDNVLNATGFLTSGGNCWKPYGPASLEPKITSAYLPMLQLSKLLYSECLASIYRSTTFVFTDVLALQFFIGYCRRPPPAFVSRPRIGNPPPAFLKHATSIEMSFKPTFDGIPCTNSDFCEGNEDLHEKYDFHWLRLNEFQHLSTVRIWIATRAILRQKHRPPDLVCFNELSLSPLQRTLTAFSHITSVIISTPLEEDVGVEDGFIETKSPSVRVWRRGAGDHFHPFLGPHFPGGPVDGVIHYKEKRKVQIGRNGVPFN